MVIDFLKFWQRFKHGQSQLSMEMIYECGLMKLVRPTSFKIVTRYDLQKFNFLNSC